MWKVLAAAAMLFAVFLTLALSLSLTRASHYYSRGVTFHSTPPIGAVKLSPTLLSFSIEQDNWTNWTGTTSRNNFFFNLLNNLAQRTGSPPLLRIGANSEDHTIFDPNVQFSTAVFPPYTTSVPYPEAINISVGDAYYQTAQFLLPGTHVIWGVNLGQKNISAASLEAQSILKAFSTQAFIHAGIVLDAIEIGNEPDLYGMNGMRSINYSSSDYFSEWSNFAPVIASSAHITQSSHTKFWIGAFADSSHSEIGFSPQALLNEGLSSPGLANLVSTYSQHHYSGSFCQADPSLLQDLMSKSNIRGNLSAFVPDIASVRAHGFHYVLGETNSYACHGTPGVSNTAGAALWTLDYSFFAASIGVSRLFFHEGIGYKYNFIQPVPLTRSTLDGSPLPSPQPAHVQPPYYAAIIIAEAIGTSGNVRMAEIQINDTDISGYAFYETRRLVRAVFINSKAFLKGDGTRPGAHLYINLGGTVSRNMQVKRLTIGYADDTSGLTWGGQSYETMDGRASGGGRVEWGPISSGVVIQASEAILVQFV